MSTSSANLLREQKLWPRDSRGPSGLNQGSCTNALLPQEQPLCVLATAETRILEDNPVSIFRGGESSPSKPLARGKLSPRTSCPFTFLDSYRKCAPLWLDKSSANAALSLLKLRRSDRLNRKPDVSSCRHERRIA